MSSLTEKQHPIDDEEYIAQAVREYLFAHPDFFAKHLDVLSVLTLPTPSNEAAISLTARQLLLSREKNNKLEAELNQLVTFAYQNEKISEKVHQFSLMLAHCQSNADIHATLTHGFKNLFQIEDYQVIETPLLQQSRAYCLNRLPATWQAVLDNKLSYAQSFAILPLVNQDQSLAMCILASHDAQRFHEHAEVLFLQRMADLLSVTRQRLYGI